MGHVHSQIGGTRWVPPITSGLTKTYIRTSPPKKRVIHICEAISEMTGREQTLLR